MLLAAHRDEQRDVEYRTSMFVLRAAWCPGAHVASWRVSGSLIDPSFASTGAVTAELIRGSGTSQSAAVVSGEAALVV